MTGTLLAEAIGERAARVLDRAVGLDDEGTELVVSVRVVVPSGILAAVRNLPGTRVVGAMPSWAPSPTSPISTRNGESV